ncbi:MAG: hypothetical protein ACI94Y_000482 [Maribacter sp.]|jgi:hypothetical protein
MIETLISSKTRIKLLLKFFLNSNMTSYLRGLESEFGESSNAIRVELNRFEKAGMLSSFMKGNRKYFQANIQHPMFSDIHKILLKYVGLDSIIENVVNKLGDIEKVFVVGEFSKGLDSEIIDLIFLGNIDKIYLLNLIEKAEQLVDRKIRYLIYNSEEVNKLNFSNYNPEPLLLWSKD